MKILYVEDNDDNIYMLSRRLKRKGFEVLIAVNGKLGVELCLKEIPDLILMDLSLPIMDGWQAIEIIKNDPAIKHIPIIALSAHAMDQHKQQALEAGADDFDSKPVDLARLMSKINCFIGEIK
jgi:two-component system cell cycle response regulator DivK